MKNYRIGNVEVQLKPCPCCGNRDLYIGHESCDTMAVVCWGHGGGCGLRLPVCYPDTLKKAKTLEQVSEDCLMKAAKLWNRRVS